jgi:hypothetical protein
MQQQMLNLMAVLASNQQELLALKARDNQRSSESPSLSSSKEPKANDPASFDGKNPEKLEQFITQCELVFKLQPSCYSSESVRVNYMISYLSGFALDAVRPFIDVSPTPVKISTKEDFVRYLRSNFGDPDIKGSTIRKLRSLVQKGSAAEYFSRFREYIAVLGWREEIQIVDRAIQGLKPEIKDEIARHPDNFDTLDELVRFVTRLDNRLRAREIEKKTEEKKSEEKKDNAKSNFNPKAQTSSSFASVTQVQGQKACGVVPSQTTTYKSSSFTPSANTSAKPPQPELSLPIYPGYPLPPPQDASSEVKREYRMTHGFCLFCGEKGHSIGDCKARERKARPSLDSCSLVIPRLSPFTEKL